MTSRLKRITAAQSKNCANLSLQKFLRGGYATKPDFEHAMRSCMNKFFSANNRAFINVINDIYKVIIFANPYSTFEELKYKCIETINLSCLFIKNKLSENEQLKFFNSFLEQLDYEIDELTSINCP